MLMAFLCIKRLLSLLPETSMQKVDHQRMQSLEILRSTQNDMLFFAFSFFRVFVVKDSLLNLPLTRGLFLLFSRIKISLAFQIDQ